MRAWRSFREPPTRSTWNGRSTLTGCCTPSCARWGRERREALQGRRALMIVPARDLRRDVTNVVLHLRLPVQVTLAPLYLWGVFGAGARWSAATVGGFVVVHLFLYGGTTLFNSYYDRDVGPIAGIERPVALPSWALAFSLAWQLAGAVPALLISPAFAALYVLYATAGLLYSHHAGASKPGPT